MDLEQMFSSDGDQIFICHLSSISDPIEIITIGDVPRLRILCMDSIKSIIKNKKHLTQLGLPLCLVNEISGSLQYKLQNDVSKGFN